MIKKFCATVRHCISAMEAPKIIKQEEFKQYFEANKEEIQKSASEFNNRAEIWRQRLAQL